VSCSLSLLANIRQIELEIGGQYVFRYRKHVIPTGVFFISISFFGIFLVYFIAKKKVIEPENLDKLIELGKWVVVSVALTLSTSMINDGFREREQDIKEMESFDKYTEVVLAADGAEKRKLLSEYFAAVSPEGPIKKSWESYNKLVIRQILEIKEVESRSLVLAKKIENRNATISEVEERIRLVERSASINQSLVPKEGEVELKPRIYFHIRNESQRIQARKLANGVTSIADVVVPGIQRLDIGPKDTELRYFRVAEEKQAIELAEILSSLGLDVQEKYVPGHEASSSIRPLHYELWISDKNP
jgi:hypothetical protein